MKREDLLYKLTGTETPLFISERENVIIDKCLNLINDLESEVKNLDISLVSKRSELLNGLLDFADKKFLTTEIPKYNLYQIVYFYFDKRAIKSIIRRIYPKYDKIFYLFDLNGGISIEEDFIFKSAEDLRKDMDDRNIIYMVAQSLHSNKNCIVTSFCARNDYERKLYRSVD